MRALFYNFRHMNPRTPIPVTKRETEILALVVAGNTSQQIADL